MSLNSVLGTSCIHNSIFLKVVQFNFFFSIVFIFSIYSIKIQGQLKNLTVESFSPSRKTQSHLLISISHPSFLSLLSNTGL